MRTKLLALTALILFCYDAHAQAPDWVWSKDAGGRFNDYCWCSSIDARSNVLITGMYQDSSITFGSTILHNFTSGGGVGDVFVAKYDSGGHVLWANAAGGNGDDQGNGVCSDAKGNVYATGGFDSHSIVFGTDTFITNGVSDVFVVKYDPNGNIKWARHAGSNYEDAGEGVSTDANGNLYVIGYFSGPSITFGSFTLTNPTFRASHIFVVKYDSSGNVLWANEGRSYYADWPADIATDAFGNVYGVGYSQSDTLIFGTDTLFNKYKSAYSSTFLVKYDDAGNVKWARNAGDTSFNTASGVATDLKGNAVITGNFNGNSMIFGTDTLTYTTTNNLFVAKYDSSGNVLWAKGAAGVGGQRVATDVLGNVYVDGSFNADSVVFGSNTLHNDRTPFSDIFIGAYNPNGNILWGKGTGGTYNDVAVGGVSVDAGGAVFISGNFWSPTIIFGANTITNSSLDTADMFIAKLKGSISTGIEKQETAGINVIVYPNPVSNKAIFYADKNLSGATLTVYNVFGQKVKQIDNISGQRVVLYRDNLPTGVYLFRIAEKDNVISSGKLVIAGD